MLAQRRHGERLVVDGFYEEFGRRRSGRRRRQTAFPMVRGSSDRWPAVSHILQLAAARGSRPKPARRSLPQPMRSRSEILLTAPSPRQPLAAERDLGDAGVVNRAGTGVATAATPHLFTYGKTAHPPQPATRPWRKHLKCRWKSNLPKAVQTPPRPSKYALFVVGGINWTMRWTGLVALGLLSG